MGFNIGIGALDKKNEIDTSCDVFLDRLYYNFISEYINEKESYLNYIQIISKLDVSPLADIIYIEDDQNSMPSNLYSITELIELITQLKNYIGKNSDIIIKNQNAKNQHWKKYVTEEFENDLALIILSLKCFEEKGYTKVFFWFG
ncbi:MAG: hypothetical protein QM535_16915 [Limnohabitans sp.]|nr:hypothetical protein [Limnohabitans sp.]